jgi:hypothetical protein
LVTTISSASAMSSAVSVRSCAPIALRPLVLSSTASVPPFAVDRKPSASRLI